MKNSTLLGAMIALSAVMPAAVQAEDGPLSGKFEVFGGYKDYDPTTSDHLTYGIAPSVTANLGHGIGIQLDGLYTKQAATEVAGAAGHLYLRNSEKGLIGLTGAYMHNDAADIFGTANNESFRIGAEVERYFRNVTLSAIGGYEKSLHHSSWSLMNSKREDFYGKLTAAYYPTDDWKLSTGYRYLNGGHFGMIGAEHALNGTKRTGISVFADAMAGEHDVGQARIGVKFYFGGAKTLIQRHRTEDPENGLPDDLATQAVNLCQPNHYVGVNSVRTKSYYGCGDF